MSSFWYSIDLPSYPCNAKLSTRIIEGAEPESDDLLRRVALENGGAGVSATAFTIEISKTNFPPGAVAKVYFSVNSNWITSLSDSGKLFIWRIADDKTNGQILPTNYLSTDPVNNIDYFEADSPLGFSTFGVSSITDSNNPFQMVAFVAANIINQGESPVKAAQGSGSGSSSGTSNCLRTRQPDLRDAGWWDSGSSTHSNRKTPGALPTCHVHQCRHGRMAACHNPGLSHNSCWSCWSNRGGCILRLVEEKVVEAGNTRQVIFFSASNQEIILTGSSTEDHDLFRIMRTENLFYFHRIQNNNFITISDSFRYITENKIITGI